MAPFAQVFTQQPQGFTQMRPVRADQVQRRRFAQQFRQQHRQSLRLHVVRDIQPVNTNIWRSSVRSIFNNPLKEPLRNMLFFFVTRKPNMAATASSLRRSS